MTDRSDSMKAAEARRTLSVLTAEVDRVRADLAMMRRDLSEVRGDFGATRAAQLLEANERLVKSALHARMLADTAREDLETLSRASQFDELTDTPNRSVMQDRIANAIAQARRHRKATALLFIDLDNFKVINDSLGHAAGDQVLQTVAATLSRSVRDSDTVSRFGGDEFLVLLAEVNEPRSVALVAAKILAALASAPDAAAPSVSASIGIALFPNDGSDPATLIKCADAAMYRAKRRGGGTFQFHSDDRDIDTQPDLPAAAAGGGSEDPTIGGVPAGHSQRTSDLLAANEQLVISAVGAQQLAADAEATQKRQIKFLAMVAHELRNPLMPMRTAADLLMHACADEAILGRVQTLLRRQIGYMSRLIDDLLDGARVSTGKFHLERGHVDMRSILEQAADACRPAIALRKQQFTMQVSAGDFHVSGESMRLTQVITNLLDNASKYTLNGGHIALSATVEAGLVCVAIADDGIGVTAEALPRIFDLFEQEHHATAHHGGGLGIGLSIVRDLITEHGGSIIAASPGRGRGTTFTITLPCEPVESRPAGSLAG